MSDGTSQSRQFNRPITYFGDASKDAVTVVTEKIPHGKELQPWNSRRSDA
jgi:hypothetical protein